MLHNGDSGNCKAITPAQLNATILPFEKLTTQSQTEECEAIDRTTQPQYTEEASESIHFMRGMILSIGISLVLWTMLLALMRCL